MKKTAEIPEESLPFREIITSNLEFINRQCRKAVTLSSGAFSRGPIDIENESDILFNRVLEKLSSNDFLVLRKFEGRSRITTYISTIIARTSVDLIREKRGRRRSEKSEIPPDITGTAVQRGVITGEEGQFDVPDHTEHPETRVTDEETHSRLRSALTAMITALNPEEKLLLRVKYPTDPESVPMTTDQISGMLGISPKAVYNRLERLIKKCRRILDNHGVKKDVFN